MLFMSLSLLSGMLLSTQVTLVSTHDGQLGKIILEKTSAMNLVAAVGIFLVKYYTNIFYICSVWVSLPM